LLHLVNEYHMYSGRGVYANGELNLAVRFIRQASGGFVLRTYKRLNRVRVEFHLTLAGDHQI